ncbi:hypothetical protein P4377_24810 [Bacillus thuringiensis]|nr:hypothetical protein [Bacillus thuringiensis]
MVGCEPGRAAIEEEINVRGGTFQWAHGKKEREITFRKMIRNADVVMLMLEHMGHGGATSGAKGVVRIAKGLSLQLQSIQEQYNRLFSKEEILLSFF